MFSAGIEENYYYYVYLSFIWKLEINSKITVIWKLNELRGYYLLTYF